MLAAWGRLVYRFRWWVLMISVLSLGPALLQLSFGGHLDTIFIPLNSESGQALDLIKKELPQPPPSFNLIFTNPSQKATDPEFQAEVEKALAPLQKDPRVARIITAYGTGGIDRKSISRDGHSTIAKVEIKNSSADETVLSNEIYPALRKKIKSDTLKVTAFGITARNHDFSVVPEKDIRRAELTVLPIVGLLLVLVFGSVLAAVLPLAVGVLAVTGGMAGTLALSRITHVLVFANSIVVMVGLGVAIDYSLFIVSRFRQEARRSPVPEALANTMATSGRAILFSGATVAIGLLGLMCMKLEFLSSMGFSGAIVVALAVFYAMTFLPALLSILGQRINALSLPFLRVRNQGGAPGFWHRLATLVMAHPWRVLIPATLFLLFLGIPFFHIHLTTTGVSGLPETAESRMGQELMRRQFPQVDTNPVIVVVHYEDRAPLSADRVGRLYDLSRWLAKLPGVIGIESPVDLDSSISESQYRQLLTLPPTFLPQGVRFALKQMVGKDIVMLVAKTSLRAGSGEALGLVRAIRKSHPPVDGKLMVSGESAFHIDMITTIKKNSPFAIGLIVAVTYVVLFLLLGSLLLPLKAVLMNIVSISASYGALVWIFQDGHLSSWLNFTPGPIEAMVPIIMFCLLFGLSMDYEVFLLSRVREEYEHSGDSTRAVAESLEQTGRLITGAAAIMAVVLFAFGLADMVVIKAMGIGMGIAVVMDATIVRALLVPATMRLLGRWNWWAPRPLARLYRRLNLGERHSFRTRNSA